MTLYARFCVPYWLSARTFIPRLSRSNPGGSSGMTGFLTLFICTNAMDIATDVNTNIFRLEHTAKFVELSLKRKKTGIYEIG